MKIKFLILSLFVFAFSACYAPVGKYTKEVFGDGIFVDIVMDSGAPETSVGAKDAINLAVMTRFNNRLASRQNADTIINMRVNSIANSPVAYDENGFVSFYRITVNLSFDVKSKGGNFQSSSSGYYDYEATSSSAVVIEESKIAAVSTATTQALDKFISQAAYFASRIKPDSENAPNSENSTQKDKNESKNAKNTESSSESSASNSALP